MLTIRIVTIHGETVQLDVQQVEFVRTCPHCRFPFRTIDPDQIYCKPSHKVRASEYRRLVKELSSAANEAVRFGALQRLHRQT